MKKRKRIVFIELLSKNISWKLNIPLWFIALILLLPIIAYSDTLLFADKSRGFIYYLGVSALEIVIFFGGYSVAINTKKFWR